jgi:cell division protein FtsZ
MINLDFSDIKTVMSEMGKAMMGTGEAQGEGRAIAAAEAAIANPLIDDVSLKGAKGLIINITGGKDITLYEVDEAANRIKQEVDEEANIIYGTTCDDRLEGVVRVSIVATGIDVNNNISAKPIENFAPININNDIYKQDIPKSESLTENMALQEHSLNDGSTLDEEINGISNEDILDNQNSENIDLNEQTNINQIETESLEENTDDKVFEQNVVSESVDQIETDYISEEASKSSPHVEKPNETSVRRLSLFDTLSNENKSEDISSENEPLDKTEPVFASSEEKIVENESEDNNSEDNNLSIDEKEEFSAEETESSGIDDDFNQETEEELLDIPTFLRRQAN